jgi:putative membrane protein
MIKYVIQSLLCNLAGIWVADQVLSGLNIRQNFYTYLFLAGALIFVNLSIKPVLKVISFPINLITLGFFSYVINALVLYIAILFVDGVTVRAGQINYNLISFVPLKLPEIELNKIFTILVASLLISFVNWLLKKLVF